MEARRGLSGTALKYLAALFMLLDHVGVLFATPIILGLPGGSLISFLLRCIGRLAFPIFLFFIAEGCRKTQHFPNYLLRLTIFAALSEIPFRLMVGEEGGGSIMLTFLLGALAIYGFQRLVEREAHPLLLPLPLIGACLLALLLNTDYGFPAVLLLFALYLCGAHKRRQLLCLSVGLVLFYLVYSPLMGLLSFLPVLWGPLVAEYLLSVMPSYGIFTLFALGAVLLIASYNGSRGSGSRWFFYAFYPAHILLLFLLSLLF